MTVGHLQMCQHLNQGCQKEKRKSKKLKNYLKKKMKENFPNLAKEIDIQIQEAQRVSNKMDVRGPLQDTS